MVLAADRKVVLVIWRGFHACGLQDKITWLELGDRSSMSEWLYDIINNSWLAKVTENQEAGFKLLWRFGAPNGNTAVVERSELLWVSNKYCSKGFFMVNLRKQQSMSPLAGCLLHGPLAVSDCCPAGRIRCPLQAAESVYEA